MMQKERGNDPIGKTQDPKNETADQGRKAKKDYLGMAKIKQRSDSFFIYLANKAHQ
jgi:hypothetical protein